MKINIPHQYTYDYVSKYSIYCFVCCLKFYKSFFLTPFKVLTAHIEVYAGVQNSQIPNTRRLSSFENTLGIKNLF